MAHRRHYNIPYFLVLVFNCFIDGCLSLNEYGTIRDASRAKDMPTIKELTEKWQDYHLFYAWAPLENPSAVLFDPKMDDRRLVHEKWVAVKDQAELISLIGWIDLNVDFFPGLSAILGPDDEFYGYVYSAWTHVLIKVVDEKTLWIDDLPLPPVQYDDHFMDP